MVPDPDRSLPRERRTNWPSSDDVDYATPVQLMRWNRFLESPRDEVQRRVLTKIIDALHALPRDVYVTASKEAGWD
jgi:hypothetical protein